MSLLEIKEQLSWLKKYGVDELELSILKLIILNHITFKFVFYQFNNQKLESFILIPMKSHHFIFFVIVTK